MSARDGKECGAVSRSRPTLIGTSRRIRLPVAVQCFSSYRGSRIAGPATSEHPAGRVSAAVEADRLRSDRIHWLAVSTSLWMSQNPSHSSLPGRLSGRRLMTCVIRAPSLAFPEWGARSKVDCQAANSTLVQIRCLATTVAHNCHHCGIASSPKTLGASLVGGHVTLECVIRSRNVEAGGARLVIHMVPHQPLDRPTGQLTLAGFIQP